MDDLIFLNRNRNYGAYVMRLNYGKTMSRAILLASIIFWLIICLPLILKALEETKVKEEICEDIGVFYFQEIPIQNVHSKTNPILVSGNTSTNKTSETTKVVDDLTIIRENSIAGNSETFADVLNPENGSIQQAGKASDDFNFSNDLAESPKTKETKIFSYAEIMPEFPGGQQALNSFIRHNLNYPSLAKGNDIEGVVLVQFIVMQDGKIDQLRILKSLGYGCDEEALRVIRSMPNWKPGKHNGVEVPVIFIIPLKFTLIH